MNTPIKWVMLLQDKIHALLLLIFKSEFTYQKFEFHSFLSDFFFACINGSNQEEILIHQLFLTLLDF